MNSNVFQRIEQSLDGLSPSEKRVGEWLISNSHEAIERPLAEVATLASVSEPTVIRFCRSIGMPGFRELRKQLIVATQKAQTYVYRDVELSDEPVGAALKVLETSLQTLLDLRGAFPGMPFDVASERLGEANQITFAGLGASGCVAEDACHKFFRLGVPSVTALDPQTILQRASIARRGDVFVVISHTGRWPDLVHAMSLCRANGGVVIGITDESSAVAEHCDVVFHCHSSEDTNVFTPMSSRLAQLTLLDALQVCLAIRLGTSAENNLRQTKEALASFHTTGEGLDDV